MVAACTLWVVAPRRRLAAWGGCRCRYGIGRLDIGSLNHGGLGVWMVVARRLWERLGGLGSGGSWLSEFWLWDLGGVGLGCGGLGAWMTEALRFGRW